MDYGKHAYLILAHMHLRQLRTLVSLLDDPRNDIYIHIDRKAPFRAKDLEGVCTRSTVYLSSRASASTGAAPASCAPSWRCSRPPRPRRTPTTTSSAAWTSRSRRRTRSTRSSMRTPAWNSSSAGRRRRRKRPASPTICPSRTAMTSSPPSLPTSWSNAP